jgi:Family of unknown function (DUF6325)
MGPVEFTLLEFPKRSFDGEIAKSLADLADREIVSIFDLLMVSKHDDWSLDVVELVDAVPSGSPQRLSPCELPQCFPVGLRTKGPIRGRNYVHVSVRTQGGWESHRQPKHHRWCLDGPQIRQYHLSRALDPSKLWWEAIELPARNLHFTS